MDESKSSQWLIALVAIVAVVSIVTMTFMGRGSSGPSAVYMPSGEVGPAKTLGGQAAGTECHEQDGQTICDISVPNGHCEYVYNERGLFTTSCWGPGGNSFCQYYKDGSANCHQ